jgi:ATP-binding cassette subfamily F protein uup
VASVKLATTASRSAAAKKLSFKDQHALKTLPARMEELSAEIARLETQLADPDFYRRDPSGFARAGTALDAARTALGAAEEEWLRLEILRESVAG